MFKEQRIDFQGQERGFPSFLFKPDKRQNMLWGTEYLVFVDGVLNDSEIDSLIEGLIFLKVTEKVLPVSDCTIF